MRLSSVALLIGLSSVLAAQPALAQGDAAKVPAGRSNPPTGVEIAAAARASTLDGANAITATLLGKPFKFTPAQARPKTIPDAGVFLGVLENGAMGDETGLPPGKYNLFAARVGGQWKGYAESNGQIAREAIRVRTDAAVGAKPQFSEKGWCVITIFFWLCF